MKQRIKHKKKQKACELNILFYTRYIYIYTPGVRRTLNAVLRGTRAMKRSTYRHLDGHPWHHSRSGAGLAAEVLGVLLHVRDWPQRINELEKGVRKGTSRRQGGTKC